MWQIFMNPFATATVPDVTPNPIANIDGSAQVFTLAGGTKTRTGSR